MTRIPALVTPALLVWARETAGYRIEDVAGRLRVPPERVGRWESGAEQPTIGQAKRLAQLYHRPLALFYLSSPPPSERLPEDYRHSATASKGIGPALRYEIRKVHYRRETALLLLEEAGEHPEAFGIRADRNEHPLVVAERLRSALGVTIEQQLKWPGPATALKAWLSAVENLGVLVFQTEIGPWGVSEDEMWGVSIHEPVLPAIILNGRLARAARIFTLMHEYVHLAIRTGGLCDLEETEQVEVFCNRVAGEILVPQDDLLPQAMHLGPSPLDEEIKVLAERYSVSREALVRRLLVHGRVSPAFYEVKRAQYRQEFRDLREAQKALGTGGPIARAPMIVRTNGVRYTGLVLEAYHDNLITLTDVSRYLGMNLKHLDRVEATVSRAR